MSSKRAIRRKTCKNKVRHASQDGAMIARSRLKRDGMMNTYQCKFCGGWHVGHAPMTAQRRFG